MSNKQNRQEAKQIAQRMADQGKSAAQIQNRIENKTNVSSSAAQNIAARVAPPSGPSSPTSIFSASRSSSDNNNNKATPSIAGVQIGKKLNAGEVQQLLDKGLTLQQIQNRADNKGLKSGTGAKNLFTPAAPTAIGTPDTTTTTTETGGGDVFGESQIPYSEYDLFGDTLQAQIQNQGLEQVERIRQAGATERLKYEVDNKIPQIQAESKGKIDLQAIVNAGYKNIANIERGTEMVRNITSMFNF